MKCAKPCYFVVPMLIATAFLFITNVESPHTAADIDRDVHIAITKLFISSPAEKEMEHVWYAEDHNSGLIGDCA